MPGTFITFEGIDGSGKSTQLRLLGNFLRANGCDAILTREPGGTTVGLRLRAVLLDAMEEVDPLTELLVFAADRAQHVRRLVRPALDAGKLVISDRYADATVAYQGAGRGFTPELISQIVDLATEGLKPDLTLLFDLPIAESTYRTARRSTGKASVRVSRDRLDIEHADFHTRVRDAYLQIALAEPERVKLIDTSGPVEHTHERVKEIIIPFLQSRRHLRIANCQLPIGNRK
ncbi:MAG TPA: dTMP kinase [Pyrinomonadaceae bacterium]|nr:dTMP kinase [Pyrinomonadaceae bacterium]